MVEEWRTVPGYEGSYEVSSLGRVRSLARTIMVEGRWTRRIKPRIRKAPIGSHGYRAVVLNAGGTTRTFTIHGLVARVFIGEPAPGQVVCHNDGDKANNAVANLRWGTPSDNGLDTVRHGRNPNALKTHCVNGHEFTPENTYVRKAGGRNCRACVLANSKRRWLERKAAA